MLKIMVCECEVHRDEFTQFFSITAAAVAANLQQIPENVFLWKTMHNKYTVHYQQILCLDFDKLYVEKEILFEKKWYA